MTLPLKEEKQRETIDEEIATLKAKILEMKKRIIWLNNNKPHKNPGRIRVYKNNAEKQRAYRQRKKEGN